MKRNLIIGTLLVLVLALGAAQAQTAQIGGQILGDDGKPLVNAKVTYSDANTGRKFNYKTDKKGQYTAIGVPYGNYVVAITNEKGQEVATVPVSVGANPEDNQIQLDLSKPDSEQQRHISRGGGSAPGGPAVGGHTLPSTQGADQTQKGGQPAQQQPKYTKEQIEEIKKQNEKATGTNTLIQQALNSMNAKNWQEAIPVLQQLIAADPNNWQYYSAMGDCLLNTDQYDQAVENYEKGIQLAESNTTVDPKNPSTDPARKKAGEAKMLTNEGNALLKLHKNKEAVDAYTKAASMDPNPAIAYFNLCATQYNTGNVEGALAACDKAIAVDPNRADAYFIKGSLMIASSKTDKDGKVEAPPGTADALNKYLELQPDGPHAADVKQMLAYIGSKVETTYKKRGK
ncbi:MAG TPA: tetratricopeptide repeat protein [Candidatus Angelobacter sp.]|nr:tetratricopeptide repeat protein [Candidatus Angelobacter sp.]